MEVLLLELAPEVLVEPLPEEPPEEPDEEEPLDAAESEDLAPLSAAGFDAGELLDEEPRLSFR